MSEVEANEEVPGEYAPHGVPADRSSLFLVNADGYQLTEWVVDPERIHQIKSKGGAQSTLREIRLKRGWRTRVFVVDLTTQAYVPGVSIHVDGEHVGETDLNGCYWIDGPQPPKELAVALMNKDLEVVMNSFDAPEGKEGKAALGYPVMVRPR